MFLENFDTYSFKKKIGELTKAELFLIELFFALVNLFKVFSLFQARTTTGGWSRMKNMTATILYQHQLENKLIHILSHYYDSLVVDIFEPSKKSVITFLLSMII